MIARKSRCPACEGLLGESMWLGVKRLPPRCPTCEVELRYDTAGGIHAREAPIELDDDTDEETR